MLWSAFVCLASLVSAGHNVLDRGLLRSSSMLPHSRAAATGMASMPHAVGGLVWLPPIPRSAATAAMGAGMLYLLAVRGHHLPPCKKSDPIVVLLLRFAMVPTALAGAVSLGERLMARAFGTFAALKQSRLEDVRAYRAEVDRIKAARSLTCPIAIKDAE